MVWKKLRALSGQSSGLQSQQIQAAAKEVDEVKKPRLEQPISEDEEKRLVALRDLLDKQGDCNKALEYDNVELVRFLRARDCNVEKACKMIVKMLKWRESYGADSILTEDFSRQLSQNKMHFHGVDKDGHPIFVFRTENHLPKDNPPSQTARFVVYLLEKHFQERPDTDKITVLFDRLNTTRKHVDIAFAKHMAPILQDCYPERLHVAYMFPVVSWLQVSWKIVKIFLDQKTKQKVVFLGKATWPQELLNVIDASELEPRYRHGMEDRGEAD